MPVDPALPDRPPGGPAPGGDVQDGVHPRRARDAGQVHRDEALGQEGEGQGARQGLPGDARTFAAAAAAAAAAGGGGLVAFACDSASISTVYSVALAAAVALHGIAGCLQR